MGFSHLASSDESNASTDLAGSKKKSKKKKSSASSASASSTAKRRRNPTSDDEESDESDSDSDDDDGEDDGDVDDNFEALDGKGDMDSKAFNTGEGSHHTGSKKRVDVDGIAAPAWPTIQSANHAFDYTLTIRCIRDARVSDGRIRCDRMTRSA